MRVFIDTNIYRKIFEGNPSVEYFEKLQKLLKDKAFDLVFPKITQVEIYKNIAEIFKKEPEAPKWTFPPPSNFFNDKSTIEKLEGLGESYKKEWETEYKKLKKANLQVKKKMAKVLFGSLAALTIDFPESQELFRLANERKIKVYPPGKNSDPLGDQLVWELILEHYTDDDLIIVSNDGDWQDLLDKENAKINPFLYAEWQEKTNKEIRLLKDLGDLIKKFEKEFKIPEEEIKKEKQEPFFSGYPYFLRSNVGTPTIVVGTTPAGTVTVVEPLPQSVMGGSPAFLPKSTQCVDCGKDRDNESMLCSACRQRRGLT